MKIPSKLMALYLLIENKRVILPLKILGIKALELP